MTEPINSQKANHHTPTNLQLVLLVVLVGLILKDCLDTFLKLHPIPVEGLLAYIRALPPADVFQLVVFLFTFLRFVYGAHRFHERERDNPGAIIVALNLLGTVVLFLVLFLAGVTLDKPIAFYGLFVVLHIFDVFWFTIAMLSAKLPGLLRTIAVRFVLIDATTVTGLLIMWCCGLFVPENSGLLAGCAGTLFLLVGIGDFTWNRTFYFNRDMS